MKILPIITNPFLGTNQNNQYDYSQFRSPELAQNNITFEGPLRTRAPHAEPLRALMHYGVPGIYSGKYVIPQDTIDRMVDRHTFSKTIRSIVKALKPYEDRLLDVEAQFFEIVKSMAKTYPNYHLEDVIRVLAPEHNKKLINEQVPIFEEISELAEFMPEKQQLEFDKLMDTVCKRINHEPAILPFDGKEFRYKLHQFSNEYSKKHKTTELDAMIRIMRIARRMPDSQKQLQKTSKAKRLKQVKNSKTLIRKRAELLTQIEVLAAESPLKNNADLMKLFIQTRAKIYGTPIVIPFNRKTFIENIKNITDKLEDVKLAHRINQAAIKLPTSHDSLSAFVMKNLELSSDKIGYNMVSGSIGSIDHLIPFSKKGRNCIDNYAITTSYYNSERAHRSIDTQLRKRPQAYTFCQQYIDRLIELCNQGIFDKVKLPKHYITNFATLMSKLSPEEKPLILHIDKLK